MKIIPLKPTLFAILAAMVLVPACSDDSKSPTKPADDLPAGAVSDFALVDVNPNSTTHDQSVSPRDHLQQISAWYFGKAT